MKGRGRGVWIEVGEVWNKRARDNEYMKDGVMNDGLRVQTR